LFTASKFELTEITCRRFPSGRHSDFDTHLVSLVSWQNTNRLGRRRLKKRGH